MPGKRPPIMTTPELVVSIEFMPAYMGNVPRAAGSHVRPPSFDQHSHIVGSEFLTKATILPSRVSAPAVSERTSLSFIRCWGMGPGPSIGIGVDHVRPSSVERTQPEYPGRPSSPDS